MFPYFSWFEKERQTNYTEKSDIEETNLDPLAMCYFN